MASTTDLMTTTSESQRRAVSLRFLYTMPWWALILLVAGIWLFYLVFADAEYTTIFNQLREGIATTLFVSAVSYSFALLIGLVVGLIRAYPPRPASTLSGHVIGFGRVILYNLATLYVGIMRGLPILVVLLVVAFIITPEIRRFIDTTFGIQSGLRGTSVTSAIIALALTYGAYESETFRAGIQSVERGQIEAAKSLGMTYFQVLRLVVLPQALRRILPPLGNDLVAMIKDSSLVAILGIGDITQAAKLYSSASFKFIQTYAVTALLYLTMTILGSVLVRWMERRLQQNYSR